MFPESSLPSRKDSLLGRTPIRDVPNGGAFGTSSPLHSAAENSSCSPPATSRRLRSGTPLATFVSKPAAWSGSTPAKGTVSWSRPGDCETCSGLVAIRFSITSSTARTTTSSGGRPSADHAAAGVGGAAGGCAARGNDWQSRAIGAAGRGVAGADHADPKPAESGTCNPGANPVRGTGKRGEESDRGSTAAVNGNPGLAPTGSRL